MFRSHSASSTNLDSIATMSFGCGIGDVVAVTQLAWKTYKRCKDAPESYRNISNDVSSMNMVLKEIEEAVETHPQPLERQKRLKHILDGCRNVLETLNAIVDKYNSLGTKAKRSWDRARYGFEDVAEIRSRLSSSLISLNAFLRCVPCPLGKCQRLKQQSH